MDQVNDDEQVIFFEPPTYDSAILGLSEVQPGRGVRVVVYDLDGRMRVLLAEGMDVEEAEEWRSFNTLGAWLGPETPLVVQRYPTQAH